MIGTLAAGARAAILWAVDERDDYADRDYPGRDPAWRGSRTSPGVAAAVVGLSSFAGSFAAGVCVTRAAAARATGRVVIQDPDEAVRQMMAIGMWEAGGLLASLVTAVVVAVLAARGAARALAR